MARRISGWGICVLPFFFGWWFVFWLLWFALLHVTTCVHVEVFLITTSSHVRTEPQSVIGRTRGKNKSFGGGLSIWFVLSGGVVPRIMELWNWFAPVPSYDKCHDNSRTAMFVFSGKNAFGQQFFRVFIFPRNLSNHYNVNVRNHSKPRPLLIPVSFFLVGYEATTNIRNHIHHVTYRKNFFVKIWLSGCAPYPQQMPDHGAAARRDRRSSTETRCIPTRPRARSHQNSRGHHDMEHANKLTPGSLKRQKTRKQLRNHSRLCEWQGKSEVLGRLDILMQERERQCQCTFRARRIKY